MVHTGSPCPRDQRVEFSLTLPRFQDPGETDPFRRTYEFARHVESIGFAGGFVGHHSFTPETKDPSAPFVLLGRDRGPHRTAAPRHRRVPRRAAPPDHDLRAGRRRSTRSPTVGPSSASAPATDRTSSRPTAPRSVGVASGSTRRSRSSARRGTTGNFRHDGEFFHFDDLELYPPCVQQPHPPIYVGGTSAAAIDRAARLGDTWFTLPMETLDLRRARSPSSTGPRAPATGPHHASA